MLPKEIRIDGIIGSGEGEVNSQMVRAQLPPNGTDPISVKIHSEGGSVFEGFAIYDLLKNYAGPKTATVESCAFSIGSFITMAIDDVAITPNGYMMFHNPSVAVDGDAEELTKTAANLTQFKANMIAAYAAKTGKQPEEILAILGNETFLDARQCVANGFANRIVENPVIGRVFAQTETMPHGVVTALFGAGSVGENREPTPEKSMSESHSVAATIQQIKAAYPKAKSDFVVKCLEQSMPMPQVAAAAMEEVTAENTDLAARLDAVIAELTALKAANESEEMAEPVAQIPVAMAPAPPTQPVARSGVKPVAKGVAQASKSATAKWNDEVSAFEAKGNLRGMALSMANKKNPGLREQMLAESR